MSESAPKRVILVMKQAGNIRVLSEAIAEVDLAGVGVQSAAELLNELGREDAARIALVDVTGFGRDVWPLCEMLQQHAVTFVVLSPPAQLEAGHRSLEYGATSVLQKPVAKRALLDLVAHMDAR